MKRFYKEGYPNHVYCKGKDGNMIFYSTSDCIYYFTLYCCLSRKYGVSTYAFSIMPNHTHSQQKAPNRRVFISFNQDLQSVFTRGYNSWHNREGELFEKPFGSAPKTDEKHIKNNLSYICNNAAEGKLSKGVSDYRWNLMAYYRNDHPFSDKIILSESSIKMREAVKYIDKMRRLNRPLDYRIQSMLFKGLNHKQRMQVTDYIVVRYNCLDYDNYSKYFGSFEKALAGMDANTGSEHDLKEEWEDFSKYRELIDMAGRLGLDMEHINFEKVDRDAIMELILPLSRVCSDKKKLSRFLHLKNTQEA